MVRHRLSQPHKLVVSPYHMVTLQLISVGWRISSSKRRTSTINREEGRRHMGRVTFIAKKRKSVVFFPTRDHNNPQPPPPHERDLYFISFSPSGLRSKGNQNNLI